MPRIFGIMRVEGSFRLMRVPAKLIGSMGDVVFMKNYEPSDRRILKGVRYLTLAQVPYLMQ